MKLPPTQAKLGLGWLLQNLYEPGLRDQKFERLPEAEVLHDISCHVLAFGTSLMGNFDNEASSAGENSQAQQRL
jgi:hypothetical protein